MSATLFPLQYRTTIATWWHDRRQQTVIDYLVGENRLGMPRHSYPKPS